MTGRFALALVGFALAGCNAPEPPESTGGTSIEAGPCGRGVAVVETEYQSTNVSLLGLDGTVLSSSFISSATSDAQLSVPLGSDVVMPSAPAQGDEIVLLDRQPASVVTWVRVADAQVTKQLSLRTGFKANVWDYVPVSAHKAYATRFEPNGNPGQEPFDAGDDVLVIDPSVVEIQGRIDLSAAMAGEAPKFFARPGRAAKVADRVLVLLQGYDQYFTESAPSRIVSIDPESDAITDVLVLTGLHGCLGFGVSPDENRLAVTCSGEFRGTSDPDPKSSGIAIVDLSGSAPELTDRIDASTLGDAPLGASVAWAGDDLLVTTTMGSDSGRPDRVIELRPSAPEPRELLRSRDEPFSLGDVLCQPGCGVCFAADADRGVVQRFQLFDDGHLGAPQPIVADAAIGLPPRGLGAF